jgi:hypothetical protein
MLILTYATHSEGTFPDVARHPMVVVLGYGTPWKGYLHRMRVILEALHRFPNEEVVVLVDAFDTIIQKTLGLQEAFLAFDCEILVSSETRSGLSKWVPAAVFKHYQRRIFGTCKGGHTASCGLLMGYVGALKALLQRIVKGGSSDDQRNLNAMCEDFPELRVDEDSSIFENCEDRAQVASSRAFFCGLPGSLSGPRILRAVGDYARFLAMELFVCGIALILLLFFAVRSIITR